ncbi:Renin receptor [Holothuria leucospilota]|uniref:Renin receptor n=1 Tax=Holothuria leucospilota TaxID=206669 RepID=A0A9Q1H1W4_HOLLE|nr:Renin receptor [Holothuria leucospilota]
MAAAKRFARILCAILSFLGHNVIAQDCIVEVVRDPLSQFKSSISKVHPTEISDVITLSLGLSTEPISYAGLKVGDIFHRPSAALILIQEFLPDSLETCTLSQHEDISFRSTCDNIFTEFDDKEPMIVDYASSLKLTKTPKSLDRSFSQLPSTLDGMHMELDEEGSFLLNTDDVVFLNSSRTADLNFLSELQLIKDVFDRISSYSEEVVDGTPDLYSFVLSGLRVIQEEYGTGSDQAKEAEKLMNKFLNWLYETAETTYKNNMIIALVKVQREHSVRRMVRAADGPTTSVTAPPTPGNNTEQTFNVARNYPEYYPSMFNILLWFVVIFALAVYAASYMLASMDPGDTIIYRMTSQRIKME